MGHAPQGTANNNVLVRRFTGLKDLIYWDTIYSYYSNKQEEKAYVIHNNLVQNDVGAVVGANINTPSASDNYALTENGDVTIPGTPVLLKADSKLTVQFASISDLNPESIYIQVHTINTPYFWKATDLFSTWTIAGANIVFSNPTIDGIDTGSFYIDTTPESIIDTSPKLEAFDLQNIPVSIVTGKQIGRAHV